jgi:peptide/nickel transport system permease protein
VGSYIIRRLFIFIPTLFVITFLVFSLLELAPGDPLSAILRPGSSISQTTIAAYKLKFGLDKPFLTRYGLWLAQSVRGNFGFSVVTFRPVAEILKERIYPTLWLTLSSLGLALLVGIPIGIVSGFYRYSLVDYVLTLFAFAGISIPNFFIGLVIIYFFSVKLHWFPVGGMTDPSASGRFLDILSHLFLPSLALGIPFIATIVRYLRSSIIDEMNSDYTRTARAKGLSDRRVLGKHILRNSLGSTITVVTTALPLLMGGAVVIETVFIWPGMGLLLKNSIYARDYPVIMGFVLLVSVLIILCNMVADVLYGLLDPRIRY